MKTILLSLLLLVGINCFASTPEPVTSAPVVASAPVASSNITITLTSHPIIHLTNDQVWMLGIIMFMFVMFVVEHEEEHPKKKYRR
jgi:cytochrome b subunit of formate dehydrogenase